ncbi:TPA: ferredoxin family protein [Candidatus Woesearchaeota archaeon]|nr:hypothetical protein QT06_C0001G0460 [archaeon GW2011_AR15]MBS3103771.1 ferredoxin family protein [Candidatus Woesearchaeota archaeon]HIH41484.1 ferredoxin family protein [Candidatus Woesearchaeota archaeon]
MAYIITELCLRDGACVEVCPVDCIRPGEPQEEHPTFYIDPATCIDCNACLPTCPYEAIFEGLEVDAMKNFVANGGEHLAAKLGTPGFNEVYEGHDAKGNPVKLEATRTLQKGEAVDLTTAIEQNEKYFTEGLGYNAKKF